MRIMWSSKILAIMAMAVLACLLAIGQAGAWNQSALNKLINHNVCPNCDLSGADLPEAFLVDADLSGANLDKATWIDGRLCAWGFIGECK